MAEFGENLKNVREQKGYTQQTLADHLYVTRQAVSRWEGGSRYPDLMTAKKMAQFLEVSLDELLTDDDMRLYAEKNAIIENPIVKRGQLILLALAFMSMLFLSIIQITNISLDGGNTLIYNSDTPTYLLLTIVLGISIFSALFDRLTPKATLGIYGCYFGLSLLIGLTSLINLPTGSIPFFFWGNMVLNLLCLILTIYFFTGKQNAYPLPLYISCGTYSFFGIILFMKGLCTGTFQQDTYGNYLMNSTLSLLANLILLALLVIMTYTLHRKRRLSAQ